MDLKMESMLMSCKQRLLNWRAEQKERPQRLRPDKPKLLEYLRKELRHPATGELLGIVKDICRAKLIDQELFQDQKYNALQQVVEATKSLGPSAAAKAKANFDIYQKKRFKAIQLIWDFQHNDKQEFKEFQVLNQSQDNSLRRSLLIQQNPGFNYLPFSKMQGSSTSVHEGFNSLKKQISKMTSRTRVEGMKDTGFQGDHSMTPVDRNRVFSHKSSALRSSLNVINQQATSPISRFGGNSLSTRNATANFCRNTTGYSVFRARDSAQLPHNKLPDIAPVIPIEDSLKYRYTNAHFRNITSNGMTRQERLIKKRQDLALVTIDGFEKLFASNEKKSKDQIKQRKEQEEIIEAKFGKISQKRYDAAMRNSANLEGWMDKSISDFKQWQIETHNKKQQIIQHDQVRSRSHQAQFHSETKKREQKVKQEVRKRELSIRPALQLMAKDQEVHSQRAQSARSATISRLEMRSRQVRDLVQNVHERRTASAMESLNRSINDKKRQEKQIRDRESSIKEHQEQIRERLNTGRERFKEAEERSNDQRSKSNQKTFEKLERIEQQVSERKLRLEEKSIFLRCESESRVGDNQKNNLIKKEQLECIKERVKRKFIKTLIRRQQQQKTFAPPTTFEIYMTNQNIKSRALASFFLTQPKPEIKTGEGNVAQKAQSTQLTPKMLRAPHSDFSFRMALLSSQDSGTKKGKKKLM